MDQEALRAALKSARSGDRTALDGVLESVQARLRAVATAKLSRLLRGRMRTSDLLQSTYLDVVRSIDRFRGDDEQTFVVWVTRIMENNIRDKVRFYDRAKRKQPGADVVEAEEDAPAPGLSPSRRAIQVEDLLVVSHALNALSEDQRQVIELRMIEGLDYPEIARKLGRKEGAVRMLLSRARAALALEMDRLADEK